MLKNRINRTFIEILKSIKYGSLNLTDYDGIVHTFKGSNDGPNAELTLHSNKVISNMVFRGDIAFADDYRNGLWDSQDLSALIEFGLLNHNELNQFIFGSKIQQIISNFSYFFKKNTKSGSKKNIHAHYDLGNDFYQLWLDSTMTYSSALFLKDKENLSDAQNNKYDRIIDRIGNGNKEILEIGCGWGGFAERIKNKTQHQLDGITISTEQLHFANNRLKNSSRTALNFCDYRDIRKKYDAIVSIEMFEAVGEEYWSSYFSQIKKSLKPKGKAVIQTITIDDFYFENYRKTGDAIRSFIFPGGMLPSPEVFKIEIEKVGLKITDQHFFGFDYAKTLNHWLENFNLKSNEIKALNFDEPFMRLWRYYLCSCIGAFKAQRTNVMQVELQHA